MRDGVLVRDLLQLPERVQNRDFVLTLSEGLAEADRTVETYALTPPLVHAFDKAMSLIGAGLETGGSHATYLHGSFGSGKSHFMAMLGLLLDGHAGAWARTELHPLRQRFPWAGSRRLLRLPMHMIGSANLEQKIFSSYAGVMAKLHPEAPPPALHADGPLFDDAEAMRLQLGDERFFALLNQGAPEAAAGWGELAAAARWDPARFAEVRGSSDEGARRELYETLTTTLYRGYGRQSARWVDLDAGLGELSRHAAALGYDGVVLLLDELILWLASHLADLPFVHGEAQKLVKLVEAQDRDRPAPLISFIARQRDLSEFVGDEVMGSERTSLRDSLDWASGRFAEIRLEDSNLPAIVERRVVRAKDEAARGQLDRAFAQLRRGLPDAAWGALLGHHGQEPDFRRVYPFSPAVVEAMVALSDTLQRERTAIRLLTELLVEHATDLEAGGMVVVGDLFDVVAGGEDPFDRVMKDRFDRAKTIYREDLLPLIRAAQGTDTLTRCQRLRDEHPQRLGCSGCPELGCRNDNRLAKTVLMASLVPQAGPFRELTVARLVHLNHGSVATPIPGEEVATAAGRLRQWAAHIGQLSVGEGGDPRVSLRLEGVDLNPILESASEVDSPGGRRRQLQQILFDALGLPADQGSEPRSTVEWRGTRREGIVRFGNVRELPDHKLRCPDELEWMVLVDYPFDEPGFTPEDDTRRLERYVDAQTGPPNPAVAWLPTFFGDELNRELGRLVVIQHILAGDNWRKYLGHLRPEDQARARQDLERLGVAKRSLVRRALEGAYGVTRRRDGDALDDTRAAEAHVVSLLAGLEGRELLQTTFEKALQELAERVLDHRHPHHPRLEGVTRGKLLKVLDVFEQALAASDRRVTVPAADLKVMRALAEPLELLTCSEVVVTLRDSALRAVDQRREQAASDRPTIDNVRRWVDPDGTKGLLPEVADVLVAAYAHWSGREAERMGLPVGLRDLGKLPGDAVLVRPDLPTASEWTTALEKAGHLFGITFKGKALNLANLHELETKVKGSLGAASAAASLPAKLEPVLQRWAGGDGEAARLKTARSGALLMQTLERATGADLVRRLAAFTPETSAEALGRSLAQAAKVVSELSQVASWALFEQVKGLVDNPEKGEEASDLLRTLAMDLAGDELVHPLAERLKDLTMRAAHLLRTPPPPPPPPKEEKEERKNVREVPVFQSGYPTLDDALAAIRLQVSEKLGSIYVVKSVRFEGRIDVEVEPEEGG